MTSAWYFKEPLRNETKRFLIPKLCFPWLVFIVKPSISTHYYLTSSILPFNTETKKKFPCRRENYGESTYVLRHLTKYSWWIRQLSSAGIILHLWLKLVPAIGYLVNSGQLWFLSGTIIDEQRASKTEKKIDHGNVLSQRGGVSQYIREAYEHTERKGHPQIAWKLEETVSILYTFPFPFI